MAKMIRELVRRQPSRHPYAAILLVRQRCTEQLILQNQLLLERIILESRLEEMAKKTAEARRVFCTGDDLYSDMSLWRGAAGWDPFDGKPLDQHLHQPQEFSGEMPGSSRLKNFSESHSMEGVGWYGQPTYSGDDFFGAEKRSLFTKATSEAYHQSWTIPSASLDVPSSFGPIGSQQAVCRSRSNATNVDWSDIAARVYQNEKLSSANYSFDCARSFLGEEADQHWPETIDVPPLKTTMDDPRDRWFEPYTEDGFEEDMRMEQQDAEKEAKYMIMMSEFRPVDSETEDRRDSGYSDGEDGFEVPSIDYETEDEDSSVRVKFTIGGDSSVENSFVEDEGSLVDNNLVSSIVPQLSQGSDEVFSVLPSTVEEKGSLVLDTTFSGQPIKKKRTKAQKVLSFFRRTFTSCVAAAE